MFEQVQQVLLSPPGASVPFRVWPICTSTFAIITRVPDASATVPILLHAPLTASAAADLSDFSESSSSVRRIAER